jgi:hypothetical protein
LNTLLYYTNNIIQRYSKTCLTTAPYFNCISTTPFFMTCAFPNYGGIRRTCRCAANRYYNVYTGGCVALKTYNATCGARSECALNAYTQCASYGTPAGTKRCVCVPNFAYYSTVTSACAATKTYLGTCATSVECYQYTGLICSGGVCTCPTTQFYNTTSLACQWLGRTGDFCEADGNCASGSCTYPTTPYKCN